MAINITKTSEDVEIMILLMKGIDCPWADNIQTINFHMTYLKQIIQ